MQSRLRIATAALASAVLTAGGMGVLAPAAHAASGSTITTFTLGGGAISITVPASTVNLGTIGNAGDATTNAVAAPQLGATTVTDSRGALPANWSVTVSSTSFTNTTTGGSSANETVVPCNVVYSSGAASSTTNGVFTPGTTTGAGKDAATCLVNTPGATFVQPLGGNTAATWNPSLVFHLLTTQVAGTYSGTITQSAA